jgi:UDPglucose 6-dehydrogenase
LDDDPRDVPILSERRSPVRIAFKADTSDTRESPAIYIAKKLMEERARCVTVQKRWTIPDRSRHGREPEFIEDPYKAAKGRMRLRSDGVGAISHAGLGEIYKSMAKPAFLFDGRSLLDHEALFKLGFNVSSWEAALKRLLKRGNADNTDDARKE